MQKTSERFDFTVADTEPLKSALYCLHTRLAEPSRIVPFAGYLMPLWYSSITEEHTAVRETAGIFDCTHMGVLEVAGSQAALFLDQLTVNNVTNLTPGKAQYSQVLDGTGAVLDDIIIYCKQPDLFMVVINAANNDKIQAWFNGILTGQIVIDDPNAKQISQMPTMRDLRDPASGDDRRVDIALQGPKSKDVIFRLIEDESVRSQIDQLKSFAFIETQIGDADVLVSTTGYTGASTAFEIYVHPDKACNIVDLMLDKGADLGVKPCGLGSRDSLRIEAGLPLYGHELAGKHNISPFEAGYGWAVKLDKEFFVGKSAMVENKANSSMKVVRLALAGQKGVRPVREDDGVLDERGRCIGWVLSSTKVADTQITLALVEKENISKDGKVGVYYLARSQSQIAKGKLEKVDIGQQLDTDVEGTVLSRFERF